jgi:hypothetical protein
MKNLICDEFQNPDDQAQINSRHNKKAFTGRVKARGPSIELTDK